MTQKIHYSLEGNVGVVKMDDAKANAQNPEFFSQMLAALDQAEKDKVRALVLTGREKFFSAGLDLKLLPTLSPDQLVQALSGFGKMLERLYLFGAPTIAAAQGHALAGGLILYLTCDYRIALDDPSHQYGLNEMKNGIPLSNFIAAICQGQIPSGVQTEAVLLARIYTVKETFERGISHETVSSPGALLPRAMEKAKEFAALNTGAYALTKRRLRGPAFEAAKARDAQEGRGGMNPFAGLGR